MCYFGRQANACGDTVRLSAHTKPNKSDGVAQVKFILDSGATEHMANDPKFFDALTNISEIPISVAKKNQCMTTNQCGNIRVKTFTDGDCKTKTMRDVLFVKDLKCNLMSIRNLTQHGYTVVFEGDKATVSHNGKPQFIAHTNGRLYEVNFQLENDVFAGISGEAKINTVTQNLWHFRLGHLNLADMQKMIRKEMALGMDSITVNTDSEPCEPCIYGKQSKMTQKPNKRPRSHRILELVHTDVCGPMSQPAWDGSRYFVSFTDDFLRASMIYCIEKKSDVMEKFTEFVAISEAQHGSKVAKVKLDNGGEYISNELKDFCKSRGIQLIYTVPYNPAMNGVAERLNRTLMERARSMLNASAIKWHFWNEAVLTANYLKNRSPTNAYGKQFISKTPAEIWYGSKPELSHLRIFGSTCYNHIPDENRSKLEPKSSKCIMLGYGPSLFMYRLWDMEKNKLVTGRHVTFNEKSVLNREKSIEISNSEADGEQISGDNDVKDGSDNDDATLGHDTDKDGIGYSKDTGSSTSGDCAGHSKDIIHGVDDNIGNIEVRRGTRDRKPPVRFGTVAGDAHFALSAQEYVQGDPIDSIEDAKKRPDWPEWK